MKLSSLPLQANERNLSRDQMGILLALIIGIAGELIVFLIPDPLDILAPQIPMLTPRDWRVSYSPSNPWRPFLWQEKRGFHQSLYLTGDNFLSSVHQTVAWYANPVENANIWRNEFDFGTYNSWPIIESRLGSDRPASFLACVPEPGPMISPPQCWYLAYWEHWFTAFFSIDNLMGRFSLRNFCCRISINLQRGQTSSSCLRPMSPVLDSFARIEVTCRNKVNSRLKSILMIIQESEI